MDARLERSRSAILEAITEMIDKGSLAGLSITQVATKAAVTRPTFYQHFPDLASAARAAALARLEEALLQHIKEDAEFIGEELRAHLEREALDILSYLAKHRAFFARVMEEAGNAAFFEDMVSLTDRRLVQGHITPAEASPIYAQTFNRFFAGGLSWLVINWLRTEPMESPKLLAQRIAELISSLVLDTSVSKK